MCVILFAPKEVNVTKEKLKNCFENNRDGAGLMYQDHESVVIRKGFMTFDTFFAAWSAIPETVDRVAHFRIATSGKIDEGCCHPFPICDDYDVMRMSKNRVDIAMAHNGIISECTPKGGMMEKYSDTMAFIKDCVFGLKDGIFTPHFKKLVKMSSFSSKFVFLSGTQSMLIGDFKQDEGAFYSNDSFRTRQVYRFQGYEEYDETDYKDWWKKTPEEKAKARKEPKVGFSWKASFMVDDPTKEKAELLVKKFEEAGILVDEYDMYRKAIVLTLPNKLTFNVIDGQSFSVYQSWSAIKK